VNALQTLALFEEVDRLIGKNHLFKRTILLVKAWAGNEAHILGSHHGLLSSYCVRAFLLLIFNAFYAKITTVGGFFLSRACL
jgi:hypothetical protein